MVDLLPLCQPLEPILTATQCQKIIQITENHHFIDVSSHVHPLLKSFPYIVLVVSISIPWLIYTPYVNLLNLF
jgi:hypothetical protein